MSATDRTTITVSRRTLERLRRFKRHGISYDELLDQMADQYDPDAAHSAPAARTQ